MMPASAMVSYSCVTAPVLYPLMIDSNTMTVDEPLHGRNDVVGALLLGVLRPAEADGPRTPPMALISSQAILSARLNSMPSAAAQPVRGTPPPTGIGSPLACMPSMLGASSFVWASAAALMDASIAPEAASPPPIDRNLRRPSTLLFSSLWIIVSSIRLFSRSQAGF